MEMPKDWRPKVRPDLLAEVVEDDLVVLVPETDQVHLLNTTAAAIYELCSGTRSASQIAGELRRVVGASAEEIEHDVNRVLEELAEKGLLE